MKCMIIDDEEMSRNLLKSYCDKIEELEVSGVYFNPVEALSDIEKKPVDMIFLDIHMPEITGMDFLESMDDLPYVVLTTTDKSFALDAYQYNVVDYLIKPVNFSRFLKAFNKVKDLVEKKNSANRDVRSSGGEIFVNIDKKLIRIDVDTILLVEARGDYIMIKTEKKNYLVHTTMKKIEEKLPDENFLKVHRSYIVNIHKIVDIEDSTILISHEIIPVSRSKRELLVNKLNLL